jgi:hypothetical protein
MTPDLAKLGDVPADYKHYEKQIVPLPDSDFVADDVYLKWYEIRQAHRTVPDEWRAQANDFLRAEVASGELPINGDLGFVIHHLCGESFYFLIVWTWRNSNEAWGTVYTADSSIDAPYQRLPLRKHREVACVWELGAVMHEKDAWARFLGTTRDVEAKQAYLDDRYAGPC